MKRAIRRYHKRRMKLKAKRLFPYDPKYYRWADNLKFCCCSLCKWEKFNNIKSRRDRRQYEALSVFE